jgi:hypothetical protein
LGEKQSVACTGCFTALHPIKKRFHGSTWLSPGFEQRTCVYGLSAKNGWTAPSATTTTFTSSSAQREHWRVQGSGWTSTHPAQAAQPG